MIFCSARLNCFCCRLLPESCRLIFLASNQSSAMLVLYHQPTPTKTPTAGTLTLTGDLKIKLKLILLFVPGWRDAENEVQHWCDQGHHEDRNRWGFSKVAQSSEFRQDSYLGKKIGVSTIWILKMDHFQKSNALTGWIVSHWWGCYHRNAVQTAVTHFSTILQRDVTFITVSAMP